jgi:sugar phosphate isomerase/epimerase
MDLAPYAKVASAKAHGFNEKGEAVDTDFAKAMRILLDAGFRGYAELEYEGDTLSEDEGVGATARLLRRVQAELTAEYGDR